MHEEGLPAREAADAVLRDNLFGLELTRAVRRSPPLPFD